jgi:hypothetical protein
VLVRPVYAATYFRHIKKHLPATEKQGVGTGSQAGRGLAGAGPGTCLQQLASTRRASRALSRCCFRPGVATYFFCEWQFSGELCVERMLCVNMI